MILFFVCRKCGNNFMDSNKEYTGPQGGGMVEAKSRFLVINAPYFQSRKYNAHP